MEKRRVYLAFRVEDDGQVSGNLVTAEEPRQWVVGLKPQPTLEALREAAREVCEFYCCELVTPEPSHPFGGIK